MSMVMEENIKRWTARRKSALILESQQGSTPVAEASCPFISQPFESNEVPIRRCPIQPRR